MSFKKEQISKSINDNLAFLSKNISLENVIGLFDSNRGAQDFFAQLFALVFGYNKLINLDKLHNSTNYPAIDLGDNEAKIAFQITTNSDSQKIKDTINTFIKHEQYKIYDRLVVFIIGEKQAYTTTFDTQSLFTFNKDTDIWDDKLLIREIDKLEIQQLEQIQKFLQENLVEYKFPESLFDRDIKQCIEILKRDFGSNATIDNSLKRRNDGFIEQKNTVNNMSWDFFKEKIRGHLAYNKAIFDFLQNEINKDVRIDYLEVAQAIQDYYQDNANNFTSFENVFEAIFQKINTYNDNISGIDTKLKILLHNMYFNCDIGTNPNNNND